MRQSLEELVLEVAESVRPPERLSVTDAAERYRYINNPGSFVGGYDRSVTPYMIEPQDVLTSLHHSAMIFVGPAQSGKTDTFLNWLIHTTKCDPSDMMLVEKSQVAARDFSTRRIARLARHSPDYAATILPGRHNQNTFDVRYRSGMILSLSYPSINELSGKPVRYVWLSDYDRMPEDVDGEGAPFDLAAKRTTTFRRFGMCAAESTPGYEIENARWIARSPHEAPPTKGILALFNRGDRRLWVWTCVSCKGTFEPKFGLLQWPDSADLAEAAAGAYMPCPHCGQIYTHSRDSRRGVPGKRELNQSGRWVAEPGRKSNIASFWLKGPAAEFVTWEKLVFNYLQAKAEYASTGSEQALKVTINVDQGEAYLPQSTASALLPEALLSQRRELGERVVPEGVRFLIATVDVQKSSFQVLVMGYKPDGDACVVDRFAVRKSDRRDEDGDSYPVSPGSHPEDWDVLLDEVVRKTYPLADDSGRHMQIKITGIDSGGRAGVTANALTFWRRLRDEHGLSDRVLLVKGVPRRDTPRVEVSFPDAQKKDRHSGARGDVPLLLLASNTLKDTLHNRLTRKEPGGGQIVFPMWLPDTFYAEMCVEVRGVKGWENPKRLRNEAWDLAYYSLAMLLSPAIRFESMDWSSPESWAAPWDENSLVGHERRFESQPKTEYDLKALGRRHA